MIAQPQSLPVKLEQNTMFQTSQNVGLEYILRIDPDRLLVPCYTAIGKSNGTYSYGGWESRQIAGHSLGHYLSALAGFIESTGDERCVEKLNYTVGKLAEIQRKDGYIGGVPSTPFELAAKGDFNVQRFDLAGFWVPWYSVHKIYAGLIDSYLQADNLQALEVVKKMADWAVKLFKQTSEEDFQKMLICEHGGMCKVYADLYGITKDKDYLKMAERFVHKEMIEPAMAEKDVLQGFHANTQIPKFIGAARLYELTGKTEYRTAVEYFFKIVTEQRSYAIGGNSIGEHFGPAYKEKTGRDTCETCNTYNMLELAEHIFSWEPNGKVADFYETALYNHILASQEPNNGAKMYFVSTESGHFKVYGTEENSFWCCTGTGMENPERYNRFVWEENDKNLYLNLFIPSTVETENLKLTLETKYPVSTTVSIKVDEVKSKQNLFVRIPSWLKAPWSCTIDGENISLEVLENGYVELPKLKVGQLITFNFPMELSIRKTQDSSGNFSILYGPIVLGACLGNRSMPNDIVPDHLSLMNYPGQHFPPITADLRNPENWIKMVDSEKLIFETSPEITRRKTSYKLKPFYDIHHERYAIYFNGEDIMDSARLEKYKGKIIDFVEAGRQQPEIEHRFKNNDSEAGYNPTLDKSFRVAQKDGSFFSYSVKIKTGMTNKLVVSYYGKQEKENGKKCAVKISSGKTELALEELVTTNEDDVYDVEYIIPEELTKKSRLTITFTNAGSNYTPAEVYEVRTIREK